MPVLQLQLVQVAMPKEAHFRALMVTKCTPVSSTKRKIVCKSGNATLLASCLEEHVVVTKLVVNGMLTMEWKNRIRAKTQVVENSARKVLGLINVHQ